MNRFSIKIHSGLHSPIPQRGIAALLTVVATFAGLAFSTPSAHASIAYGSINNFDVVNDTGSPCHGFEIELEDVASTEITYTYDWNHYGKSKFIPSTTASGRPATCVRWESAKNADGSWAAFTAIPAGPIQPTDGHQFTDPNVNFGGEHFGVGYTKNPTAVRYFWLLDDGAGNLKRGPEVQVSTPVFNYAPAAVGVVAQVQAVIVPIVPALPEPKEFGDPVWVKEIRTTTHNNNEVKLRDLVSDDPDKPNDKNWRNGEPDEVEVEWQLLQTDHNKADGGANGELAAAPEALKDGDEVVTRRYEFFKYTGPIDDESGEALAEKVAADDLHGRGLKTINGVEVDLSTITVVGDYIGAQMAAFNPASEVGLIDQIPDAELNAEYPARRVIIPGAAPFTSTSQGQLPQGMTFDTTTGILAGTPTASGTFSIDVTAQEGTLPVKTKTYSFIVAEAGAAPPPQSVIDTSALPLDAGTLTGNGAYENTTDITVTATPNAGFAFLNWTDNGAVVSTTASYTFTTNVNRSLTANFVPTTQNVAVTLSASAPTLGTVTGAGSFAKDSMVSVTAIPNAGAAFLSWTEQNIEVSTNPTYTFSATADRTLVAQFVATFDITTTASPSIGGTTNGTLVVNDGSNVTLSAVANTGYSFVSWTEGSTIVSTDSSYTFPATSNRSLVAQFAQVFDITATAIPSNAGVVEGTGLTVRDSTFTLTATANPGLMFLNWTEAGIVIASTPTYTSTATQSRVLVAHFQPTPVIVPQALFKGVVLNQQVPSSDSTGIMSATVSKNGVFTGTLKLASTSYTLKGQFNSMGQALLSINRRGKSPIILRLQYDAFIGITGTLNDGATTASITAQRCPYSKTQPLLTGVGAYTHLIGLPRRLRPPLPFGTGTHKISSTGTVTVAGKLSDGTSYTSSTNLTEVGTFPLYSPTKLTGFSGFVVANLPLDSTVAPSPVLWQPATPEASKSLTFYVDAYTPPSRNHTAIQVDLGVPNLDITQFDAIGGLLNTWQMKLGISNIASDLHVGPGPISLRISPSNGVVSGKLNDGTVTRAFTGVVWQSTGQAFCILPRFGDQSSLTLNAIYTGP